MFHDDFFDFPELGTPPCGCATLLSGASAISLGVAWTVVPRCFFLAFVAAFFTAEAEGGEDVSSSFGRLSGGGGSAAVTAAAAGAGAVLRDAS